MNALMREVAGFLHEANGGRKEDFDKLVMIETSGIEELKGEPSYVFANLTNGRQLTVTWDAVEEEPVFRIAADEHSKSLSCTPVETGLSKISLDALTDMALTAYEDWIAEEKQLRDEFGGEES